MKILLNGQSHTTDRPLTLAELLESIGYGGRPCVVELDERAIFPRDYPQLSLTEGSRVEVVTLAAGG